MRHHLMFSQDSARLVIQEADLGLVYVLHLWYRFQLLRDSPPAARALPPLGCTSHKIQPPVRLCIRMGAVRPWYLLGFMRKPMPPKGWGGQFSPCPNTAHPTALGWLASHEVQRVALVQENIIRPLTWLELCGLRQLKSSFMLMKQFLWLWRIELIAPKFNWKWDTHIIHTGERMGMINSPGSLDICFKPNPPNIYFFFHFRPLW